MAWGQVDELGDLAAGCPGQPAGQQGPVLAAGEEDLPQVFFEQVSPIQRLVHPGDLRQPDLLALGQVLRVALDREPGVFDQLRRGLVTGGA